MGCFGSDELGTHSACTEPGSATGKRLHVFCDRRQVRNANGVVMAARIFVVQTIRIRQNKIEIGVNETGNERAQHVVVAEGKLFHRDCVVFVDDRQHAFPKKERQRLESVLIPSPVRKVAACKQYLRNCDPVGPEKLGIGLHQQALADRGCCLFGCQRSRSLLIPQSPKTARHRARGDQNDLVSCLPQLAYSGDEQRHLVRVAASTRSGKRAAAHLYNQPQFSLFHLRASLSRKIKNPFVPRHKDERVHLPSRYHLT